MSRRAAVRVEDHGTILLFRPLSDAARSWLEERTNASWFGGALACERRFAASLAEGLLVDGGFTVGR